MGSYQLTIETLKFILEIVSHLLSSREHSHALISQPFDALLLAGPLLR